MTTILSASNSEGTYGRCDAKCHKAKHPRCHCICRGRYHGAGSSDAAQDQLTKDMLGENWRNLFAPGTEATAVKPE